MMCKMCMPMCASARVASSNIMISEYRSHRELGYQVLTLIWPMLYLDVGKSIEKPKDINLGMQE